MKRCPRSVSSNSFTIFCSITWNVVQDHKMQRKDDGINHHVPDRKGIYVGGATVWDPEILWNMKLAYCQVSITSSEFCYNIPESPMDV